MDDRRWTHDAVAQLRDQAQDAARARLHDDARPSTDLPATLTGVFASSRRAGATFVTTMAGVLATQEGRALCVDADLAAHREPRHPLGALLALARTPAPDLLSAVRQATVRDATGLDILPLAERWTVDAHTPRRALARILEVLATGWDHVLIDLGAGDHPLVPAVLPLLDAGLLITPPADVIVGATSDARMALVGAGLRRSILHVVVNQLPPGPGFDASAVRAQCGAPVLTTLPLAPDHAEALWHGREARLPTGAGSLLGGLTRIRTVVSPTGASATGRRAASQPRAGHHRR